MAPFAWSTLPSVSSFLSPVTCPAASLLLPIALSTAPFTCSLSITHLYRDQMRVGENKRPSGVTTPIVGLVGLMFGLSKLASLIGTHVVAPLHLLLFIPFIELGVYLFRTRKLPMDRKQLERLSHHPLRLLHEIWQWEGHALIVWGALAGVGM